MKKVKIITIISAVLVCLGLGLFIGFKDTHKINYELDGGVNANNKSLVWENQTVKLKAPTKYGYKFTGWENKYGDVVEKLENVTQDMTLYATWELDPEFYGELPVIDIQTSHGEMPEDKKNYVPATLNMYNCENEDHNLEDKDIGIRLRGNSTRAFDKKPYRIKFKKGTSVFGLPKNKSWVLLADYIDQSAIRNYTAFNLAQNMPNLAFANSTHHVVLTINGEYKGLYLFTEQIDEKYGRTGVGAVDADNDVKISPTDTSFPFLVEMDRNALKEGITGVDNFATSFYPCEIKYPEADERGLSEGEHDVVFDYIKEYVCAVFDTLRTNQPVKVSFSTTPVSFSDLVDVDSFMEFWLVNEVMRNTDSVWGSVYMSKTQNGKLTFGPVWDFDWSLSGMYTGRPYAITEQGLAHCPNLLTNGSLLCQFIQDENNYKLLCDKWTEVKGVLLDVADSLVEYKSTLAPIAIKNIEFWHGNTFLSTCIMSPERQFNIQYDYVVKFLRIRYDYLTELLVEGNYNKF